MIPDHTTRIERKVVTQFVAAFCYAHVYARKHMKYNRNV